MSDRQRSKRAAFAHLSRRQRREDDLTNLGLTERRGRLLANCRSCEREFEIFGTAAEHDPDYAYCFGSDRCLP